MDAVNGLVPAQNQPGIELRRKDEERGEESELLQQEAPRAAEVSHCVFRFFFLFLESYFCLFPKTKQEIT